MVKILLHKGADPDLVIGGVSSRQIVLQRVPEERRTTVDHRYLSFVLSRILVIFGEWRKQKDVSAGLVKKAKKLFR